MKLLQKFSKVLDKKILSIHIRHHVIIIAEFMQFADSIKLTNLFIKEISIDVLKHEELKGFANNLLHDFSVAGITIKNVVVTIQIDDLLCKQNTYPTLNKTELEEAIKWDIQKQLPVDLETFDYHYEILPNHEKHEMNTLLVFTDKKYVESLCLLCEKCNLNLKAIEIENIVLGRMLQFDLPYMLLKFDKKNIEIEIYINSIPILTRKISFNFTKAFIEKSQAETDEIFAEIANTIKYYTMHHDRLVIEKTFILMFFETTIDIQKIFSSNLSMPIEVLNFFGQIKVEESFDDEYITNCASLASVGTGATLLYQKNKIINLLPPKKKNYIKVTVLSVLLTMAVSLILGCFWNYQSIKNLEKEITVLTVDFELLKPTLQKKNEIEKEQNNRTEKSTILINLSASKQSSYAIMNHLGTLVVDNVWLKDVEYKEGGQVTLKGVSYTFKDLVKYLKNFEQDNLFKHVNLVNSTVKEDEETHTKFIFFEIVAKI